METRTRLEALGLKEPNAVHLGVVGLLVLLLLIPLGMVRSVVDERHERYQGVVSEIAGAWSGPQTLVGPVLVVPLTVKRAVDYALLSGSLVLVAALAAAMWLTRHLHRSPASPTGT